MDSSHVRVVELPAAEVGKFEAAAAKPCVNRATLKVRCKRCDRIVEVDSYPFAPSPIKVLTGGAVLAPYLQEILDEELGPQPDYVPCAPPSHVDSCSECDRREALPREGDTFKKRAYRGKFRTIGRGKRCPVPELNPDTTYDHADQTLSTAYYKSRYGKGVDDANKQAKIREQLYTSAQLEHANEVLDGLSLRQIEQNWEIPRMTASRAQKGIRALAEAREGECD